MDILIHNKSKTIVKVASNVEQATKIIKQLTVVFNERFYVSSQDKWALNGSC